MRAEGPGTISHRLRMLTAFAWYRSSAHLVYSGREFLGALVPLHPEDAALFWSSGPLVLTVYALFSTQVRGEHFTDNLSTAPSNQILDKRLQQ